MPEDNKEPCAAVCGMSGGRSSWIRLSLVLLLLGAAAVFRILWFVELQHQPDFTRPLHDAAFKDWWGRAMVTGDYATSSGQRTPFIENWPLPNPPAYSWFLAGLYAVAGESADHYYRLVRYIQFAAGLLTVLLLYLLGRWLFGHTVGLVAAGLYASQWAVIYYEGEMNQPALVNLVVVVVALMALGWLRLGWTIFPLLIGGTWGLQILMRSESLLFLPVIPLWMVWSGFSRWRWRSVSAAVITVLAVMAVMAPVTFPHYPGSRSWFTVSYGGEVSFYLSNNEYSDGVRPDSPDLYRYLPNGEWNIFNWGELGWNYCREQFGSMVPYYVFREHFMKRGWDFIRQHPALTLRRIIRKFLLFWGPAIVDENKVVGLERARSRVLSFLPDFPLLVCGALVACVVAVSRMFRGTIRMAGARRSGSSAFKPTDATSVMLLLTLFAGVTCTTFLLFIVNARYRMPVYPALALAGGWGMVEFVRSVRFKTVGHRTLMGVAFLAIYLFARTDWADFKPNVSRWHDERRRAWTAAGMMDAGIADMRRWVAVHPEDAAGHYNLGILLYETGRADEAEQAFLRAVQADPAFTPAWYNLGLARLRRGDAAGAAEALERRVTAAPEDGDAWYALAQARRLTGDTSGEEAALRETIRIQPGHAAARNDMGALLLRTRRIEEAVRMLREARALMPEDRNIRFNLARALAQWGDGAEAVALFRGLLAEQEDAEIWRNLGFALAGNGQDEEAVTAFRRALSLQGSHDEKSAETLSALGLSLTRLAETADAEESFQKAFALNPNCSVCLFNWGQALECRGNSQTARGAYEKALALDPNHGGALFAMGMIALREGDEKSALSWFDRAVAVNPADGFAWYNRAGLLQRTGKSDDALASYRQATQCRNAPADAWRALALLLRELGRNEEAAEYFQEALKRYSGDPDLYFGLGAALFDLNQMDASQKALEQAVRLAPWDGEAWNLLGLAQHKSGQHAEASRSLERAWRRLPEARRKETIRIRALALLDAGQCATAANLFEMWVVCDAGAGDPGVWYDLARARACMGDIEAAAHACVKALERDPRHIPALLLLAESRRLQGNLADAEKILRVILDLEPSNADALFNMGLLARDMGNIAQAAVWFEQALREKPDRAEFHLNLGLALEAQGKNSEAEACFQKATELNGSLVLARLKLADRLRETDRASEALEHYRAARVQDPSNLDAAKNLGYVLLKLGNVAEAEEAFRDALRISPEDTDALLGLADALVLLHPGEADEPVELYRRVTALDPVNVRAWKNLGFLLARSGKLEESVEYFRRALQLDPQDADVACGLADALFASGNRDKAEELYRRALEIRPDFALALNNYGDLLTRAGRHEEALSCYRRAHELDPDNPSVLFNLGRALHRQGALGDAIPLLERSVALRPDDTRARLTLAQALAEAGQTEEALSHARRVALERPDWEQARQLLQTLQQPDRLTQSGNP